jgi:hypothetical protein
MAASRPQHSPARLRSVAGGLDVEYDFLRARRHHVLAALAHRLRSWRGAGNRLVPLDEVADPASWRGQLQLGRQTIRLDTIIGTAEPRRDFDRRFRPTSDRVRFRWERLALAQRRGEPIPAIEVYRVGGSHFVIDGHHRISIAAAAGEQLIEANVTQVLTAAPSGAWPLASSRRQADKRGGLLRLSLPGQIGRQTS